MKKKKHISKHKEKSKESIKYVLLNNSNSLRKDVLLNALDSVKILKEFEKYQELKYQKFQLIKNLKSIMDNIHDQFSVLHRRMPIDESLKEDLVPKKTEFMHLHRIEQRIQEPKRMEYTEEDRLKEELKIVENRLRRMGI